MLSSILRTGGARSLRSVIGRSNSLEPSRYSHHIKLTGRSNRREPSMLRMMRVSGGLQCRKLSDSAKPPEPKEEASNHDEYQKTLASGFNAKQAQYIAEMKAYIGERERQRRADANLFGLSITLACCGYIISSWWQRRKLDREEAKQPEGLEKVKQIRREHWEQEGKERDEKEKKDWARLVEQERSEEKAIAKAEALIKRDGYLNLEKALDDGKVIEPEGKLKGLKEVDTKEAGQSREQSKQRSKEEWDWERFVEQVGSEKEAIALAEFLIRCGHFNLEKVLGEKDPTELEEEPTESEEDNPEELPECHGLEEVD